MTYEGAADDDAEGIVLGVTHNVVAGNEGRALVEMPDDHVILIQLEIILYILTVRVDPYKVYIQRNIILITCQFAKG